MATRRSNAAKTNWPLGEYLRDGRGKMSKRRAARLAGISESRWRQVEDGKQQVATDVWVPVHPRPETLAAMCRAIVVDVRRGLELAGYNPEQYPWLLESQPTEVIPEGVRTEWFNSLDREDREKVLAELQRLHIDKTVTEQRRAM